jgi:hypothetical protein
MTSIKDRIIITIGIIGVVAILVVQASMHLPVVMRGFQKYGTVMSPAEVLILEALEKEESR